MIEYIKDHWVQYLIGATIAALLGLGLSFYLGEKWSTPESVRAQRHEQEAPAAPDQGLVDLSLEGDGAVNSYGDSGDSFDEG